MLSTLIRQKFEENPIAATIATLAHPVFLMILAEEDPELLVMIVSFAELLSLLSEVDDEDEE